MAHIIVAADLGGSSIKLARFEASFRRQVLLDTRVVPSPVAPTLPPVSNQQLAREARGGGEARPALPVEPMGGHPVPGRSPLSVEERVLAQLTALAQYLAQEKLLVEELVLGLPGDALAFRTVDLPFASARQIESVLGYELESEILTPVEELVLDFVIVGPSPAPGAGAGETRVLVAAAPRALVAAVVKAAAELGLPLRTVGAAPLSYAALLPEEAARELPAAGAEAAPLTAEQALLASGPDGASGAPVAEAVRVPVHLVLDLGAEQAQALVVRGNAPLFARSIARGGRPITEAIGEAFTLDAAAAEKAKLEAGFVAAPGARRLSPSQARMDTGVRHALSPLVRELRQTLAAFRASYGEDVDSLLLTGGGARLAGLAEHLAAELGLPVSPLPWPLLPGLPVEPPAGHDQLAVAMGLALGLSRPATQVNFRKGELAYRSDFSFIRGKALQLGVAAALMLLFAVIDGWVSYRGLRKEHELLTARLKKATVEVFGKERYDLSRISEELREGPKASAQVPIPSYTAFDLLEEMSRAVPPPDKIRLDIEDLDIKPKKLSIKGTTETAQQVDDLADALRKIDCFEDVQKGKLVRRTVTAPPPAPDPGGKDKAKEKDKGPTELTQFTITIKGSCP